jgi:hypothetical protein
MAIASGFLPQAYSQGTRDQCIAKAVIVAIKGRELGIPMMQAFSDINVINGRPTISASLMLALIYKAHPKAEIEFKKYTDEICEIHVRRPNEKNFQIFKFDLKDAETAGLLGPKTSPSSPWVKYPRAMLRSRVVSEMARSKFPDALMGCLYTPEELGGEVIDIEADTDIAQTKAHNESSIAQSIEAGEISTQNVGTEISSASQPVFDLEDKCVGIGEWAKTAYREIPSIKLKNKIDWAKKLEKPGFGIKQFIVEAEKVLSHRNSCP